MKILVTGANGFIGRKILDNLSGVREHTVAGVSLHEDIKPSGGYTFYTLDLTDAGAVVGCLDSFRPDVIVNTAAVSVMSVCESDPEYAEALNVGLVREFARWCKDKGARLVHISTDTVFSGSEKIFHKEDDPVSPPNVYGRTKADAEKVILQTCPDFAIIRVVLVYGIPLPGQHGNLVKLVHDRLAAGKAVEIVDDQWRTPTYVEDVACAVKKLISLPDSGIWHVCGAECLSIYEIALKAASAYGLDASLIKAVHTGDTATGFARPVYGLLDISKARKDLDFRPLTIDEALQAMINLSESL